MRAGIDRIRRPSLFPIPIAFAHGTRDGAAPLQPSAVSRRSSILSPFAFT